MFMRLTILLLNQSRFQMDFHKRPIRTFRPREILKKR